MSANTDKTVILRFPLQDSASDEANNDAESEFILVKVSRKSKDKDKDTTTATATTTSARDLDLRLFATEGEAVYRASIRSSQINKLRSKTYHGSDEEWRDVLSHVFGQGQGGGADDEEWKNSLEITASVRPADNDDEENEITISLRKRVQRITQRLGTITLHQVDEDISLFDWAGTAVSRTQKIEAQIPSLTARCAASEEKVSFLEAKMEELVGAKKQHEDDLIERFARLLNEKKLQIRRQQRIIDGSGGSDEANGALEQTWESELAAPGRTRAGKRKAEGDVKPGNETSDDDDAFESVPDRPRRQIPESSPQASHQEDDEEEDDDHRRVTEEEEETAEEEEEEEKGEGEGDEEKRETPQPMEDETEEEQQQDGDEEMRSETSSPSSKKQPPRSAKGRKNDVKPGPSKPTMEKSTQDNRTVDADADADADETSTDEDFEAAPKRESARSQQSQSQSQQQHAKKPPARTVSTRSSGKPAPAKKPLDEDGSETESDDDDEL